jgi:hypothetical protein
MTEEGHHHPEPLEQPKVYTIGKEDQDEVAVPEYALHGLHEGYNDVAIRESGGWRRRRSSEQEQHGYEESTSNELVEHEVEGELLALFDGGSGFVVFLGEQLPWNDETTQCILRSTT